MDLHETNPFRENVINSSIEENNVAMDGTNPFLYEEGNLGARRKKRPGAALQDALHTLGGLRLVDLSQEKWDALNAEEKHQLQAKFMTDFANAVKQAKEAVQLLSADGKMKEETHAALRHQIEHFHGDMISVGERLESLRQRISGEAEMEDEDMISQMDRVSEDYGNFVTAFEAIEVEMSGGNQTLKELKKSDRQRKSVGFSDNNRRRANEFHFNQRGEFGMRSSDEDSVRSINWGDRLYRAATNGGTALTSTPGTTYRGRGRGPVGGYAGRWNPSSNSTRRDQGPRERMDATFPINQFGSTAQMGSLSHTMMLWERNGGRAEPATHGFQLSFEQRAQGYLSLPPPLERGANVEK